MDREPIKAWADDVPLRGERAPKNNGSIKHLIEYLLTVYERFGNTTVTASLQWGANALWKRDELQDRIAELEEPPTPAEIAAYRDLFRAELEKRMDTEHPSWSPSTEAHAIALRRFVEVRAKRPI